MPVPKFSEVRSEHIDDDNYLHIDGWLTPDGNEEGKTLALVCMDTGKVIYMDNIYHANDEVKAHIKKGLETFNQPNETTFVKGTSYPYAKIAEVADETYMITDNQVNTIGLSFVSLEHNERDEIHSFVLVSTSGSDYNYECVYTDG